MKNYDVAIIGGGIGGLMCAYRLIEKNSDLKIILFDWLLHQQLRNINNCNYN